MICETCDGTGTVTFCPDESDSKCRGCETAPCPDCEVLTLRCAWCKATIREGTPGARVSDGICAACAERMMREEK